MIFALSFDGDEDLTALEEDFKWSHIDIHDDSMFDDRDDVDFDPKYQLDEMKRERFIDECKKGLNAGQLPELAPDGNGGTYFMCNEAGERKFVFKPLDEEAFAPNNPRGMIGEIGQPGFRLGVRSGNAAWREVAAYQLDHESFSEVPYTVIAELESEVFSGPSKLKVGSLQSYVSYKDTAGDYAPKMFSTEEVHKIAILDLRIVNCDRNDGNILVTESMSKLCLVPVDHGYSFPDVLDIAWCDWVWIDWPQTKEPLSDSEREYIEGIDIARDCAMLRGLSIREANITLVRIVNTLLKKGAAAGLTLYEIARIVSRDNIDAPSALEVMMSCSRTLAIKSMTGPKSRRRRSTPLWLDQVSDTVSEERPSLAELRAFRQSFISLQNDDFDHEVFFKYLEDMIDDLLKRHSKSPNHTISASVDDSKIFGIGNQRFNRAHSTGVSSSH